MRLPTCALVPFLVLGCSEAEDKKSERSGAQDQEVPSKQANLVRMLDTSYAGLCREKRGDTYKRNKGLEQCYVVSSVQQRNPSRCKQFSACGPTKDFFTALDGEYIPNPVAPEQGGRDYRGGAPHICQGIFRGMYESCMERTNGNFEECAGPAINFYQTCMKTLPYVIWGHYDCDDFADDFQGYCKSMGVPAWYIGCMTPRGAHAFNIAEQPDGNPGDNSCRYCAVEPQIPNGDLGPGVGFVSPVLVCWDQECGIPSVPEDIQRQRGWSSCKIGTGYPTDGSQEKPYYEYPFGGEKREFETPSPSTTLRRRGIR